jgi:hypothetical protein
MADISTISRLVSGVSRNISIQNNTLVVGSLKVGVSTPTELTKTILDNLVNLQNGGDAGALHHHDARYFTETELGSVSGVTGSDLIGDDNNYSNFTPAAATVKGALSGIDSALAVSGSGQVKVTSADTTKDYLNNKISAGSGLSKSTTNPAGNEVLDLAVNVDGSTLEINADALRIKDDGITNAKINSSAGIVYSKLNLSGSIINADINASAAIAYSKLALASSIVNADVAVAAAIAYSKLAALTASRALVSDGSGFVSASSASSAEVGYLVGVSSAIQTQIDGKVAKAGDTMSGVLNMGSNKITNLATPTAANDATNKAYVDAAVNGLSWKSPVVVATTANITLSGAQTIDGIAVVAGNRVLVKDQSTASQNGIYVAAAGAWSRSADMDSITPLDEVTSAAVFVSLGTVGAGKGYVQTATVATFPGDALSFVQFSSAGALSAGTGLSFSGSVLNVNLGAGIVELPSDEVGIDVHSAGGLITTVDGTSSSTATGAQLAIKLDSSTLALSASGLKVADGGISNTQVNASAGIVYSKLALTNSVVNADIASAAGIVYSKLALSNSIVNADISSSAAIAYSKLALSNSVVNADISSSAAIAYSKLALTASIVNADIAVAAAIARSKHVIINDGSGVLSSEARLQLSRFKDDTAGKILIAQGSGVDSAYQVVSGDLSITSSGVATIATSAKDAIFVSFVAGEAIAAGDLVYLSTSVAGEVLKADADALSTCEGLVGIADQTVSAAASIRVQVSGKRVVSGSFTSGDRGKRVYLSGTAGAGTPTAPSATNSVVFLVGHLVDHATGAIVIAPSLIAIND